MCCDPCGSEKPMVDVCPDCGMPVDEEGYTGDACVYSPKICRTCGWAPCDQYCQG